MFSQCQSEGLSMSIRCLVKVATTRAMSISSKWTAFFVVYSDKTAPTYRNVGAYFKGLPATASSTTAREWKVAAMYMTMVSLKLTVNQIDWQCKVEGNDN